MSHVSRRSLIAGAAAFTLLPRLARASMQDALQRLAEVSAVTRSRRKFITASYGPGGDEVLDVFPVQAPNAPIHLFIPGGAGSKEDVSFPAELFVPAGVIYIAVEFSESPDTLRRALAWTYKNAGGFGGDPDRIHLSGHGAGARLAALLLTTDWAAHDVPDTVIKGALCISGLYDGLPTHPIRCPVAVTHGEKDSPDVQRQAQAFAAALNQSGAKVEYAVGQGLDHFAMLETLARPDGLLGRIALKQIGVAA